MKTGTKSWARWTLRTSAAQSCCRVISGVVPGGLTGWLMETWIVVGMIVGFWWWVGGWLGMEIRCLAFAGFDRVVSILLGNGMRSCI